jgi:hypothetical protein
MSEKTKEYLICHCCHTHFYDGINSPLQAVNCACSITQDKNAQTIIDCGYPSMFDTNHFIIHDQNLKSSFKQDDLVCDSCIQKLSMLGLIEKDNNYDYWAESEVLFDAYYKEIFGENYQDKLKQLRLKFFEKNST